MNKTIRIGVVHPDADYRFGLRLLVESQPDFEWVFESNSAATALERLPDALVDVLLVDYFLSGSTGLDFTIALAEISLRQGSKLPPVVLLNVGYSAALRLAMLRSGVADILPLDAHPETVLQVLRANAFGGRQESRSELLGLFERLDLPARPNPALALGLVNLSEADRLLVEGFARGLEDAEIAREVAEPTYKVRRRLERIALEFGFVTRGQMFLALYENGKINA